MGAPEIEVDGGVISLMLYLAELPHPKAGAGFEPATVRLAMKYPSSALRAPQSLSRDQVEWRSTG